jgi:hypothetical protein
MKIKYLLKSLFFLLCMFSNAQNAKDSLLTLLKNHPKEDIGRCYILRELRKNEVRNFSPDGEIYDREAFKIATKNIPTVKNNPQLLKEYKSFQSDYLYAQGINYSQEYDLAKAEKYYKKALEIDLSLIHI